MKKRNRRQGGFTLVDTMVTASVLAISLGGFGMAVIGTQNSSIQMQDRDFCRTQAMKYMERLLKLPFGTAADAVPTTAQVSELFDDNAIVTGGAPITLKSLQTVDGAEGWRFRVQGFECAGVWEVEINTDLDGNGTHNGVRGTDAPTTGFSTATGGDGTSVVTLLSENDPNLLRIEIFWNGKSVARAIRSAPVEGT